MRGLGRLHLGHCGLQLLERQLQLVGIELLRAAAEAMALQLMDQEAQPLDLGIAALEPETRRLELGLLPLERGGQIEQRRAQDGRILGQLVQIERHDAC
jgi:hypothetical protein